MGLKSKNNNSSPHAPLVRTKTICVSSNQTHGSATIVGIISSKWKL